MRLVLAASLVLTSLPAIAADSVADQAQHAFDLFAAGLSQPAYLSAQLGREIFKGIDGTWARLGGPDPKTGIETYGTDTDRICKGGTAQTLASPNTLTLSMTSPLPSGSFVETFTLVAGATFAERTDALAYLAAIGLGPDNKADGVDQQRALALSLINGLVQIYRPSDDILVMTRDRGYPLVYARCPKS